MTRNVATWPNLVTLLRLLCLPLFLWLLFTRDDRAAAAYLLGVLGA
ncbi:MAG: CDP-alcohol phosphatidyltransferase family protein, partial [Actinobacteria bacterium]|nr:CDP-alcohol phosphatidyltransferase family protein [Actinomycetota bacterium]